MTTVGDLPSLTALVRAELRQARRVLDRTLADEEFLRAVGRAATLLAECLRSGSKVLVCGNGGSLCDAMHFAAELTGKFRHPRSPLPALALCDPAHLTAVANDFSFDLVFARTVAAMGAPGDALVALSTSGESQNVVEAARAARERGIVTIALTGRGGGRLAREVDLEIRVPATRTSDRTQEMHIKILHVLVTMIESLLDL